jgi:pyruvate dehydrogenase E1 component alpha subunit
VCENNLYASHLKLAVRQPQYELFRHAAPYGVPGIRVDGNDVLAMYEAAGNAVRRARAREGPTMLECMTYRWRGHVGPNYDLEYNIRTREELDAWIAKDPIKRFAEELSRSGVLNDVARHQIDARIAREVDESITFARESPFPAVEDLLEHVYKS